MRVTDWNPALYSRFEDERTRPARDLLARVLPPAPAVVVDLGCGPGNSTELLIQRFPRASILGIDSSPAMVDAARKRLPQHRFEQADLAEWRPEVPPDLIFANAVLQWLPNHPVLLPQLFGLLRPGGVLAVQMPDNLDEPSHRAMRAVAASGSWSARLAPAAASRGSPALAVGILRPARVTCRGRGRLANSLPPPDGLGFGHRGLGASDGSPALS